MGSIRFVGEEVKLGGCEMSPGQLVIVPPRAVNFDPTVFHEPDIFDPTRPEASRHLSFGIPPFDCPANALARAQVVVVLQTISDQTKNLRFMGKANIAESALYREVLAFPVRNQ
jgi:cytochrome P450